MLSKSRKFFILFSLLFSFSLFSQEIVISSLDDSGANTLREALTLASNDDVILFEPNLSGTILLESSLPPITSNLAIIGPSSKAVTIDGNKEYSIFDVANGIVFLRNLNTQDADPLTPGSALFVSSGTTVFLSAFTFTHLSTAVEGGAIFVQQDGILRSINVSFFRDQSQIGQGLDISFEDESGVILFSDSTKLQQIEVDGGGNIFKQGFGPIFLRLRTLPTTALNITIDEGELFLEGSLGQPVIINPNGSLKGVPTLSELISAGTAKPGLSIGTMSVLGNYVQNPSGSLEIELNALGETDLLQITGNASITGNLVVLPEPGMYFKGMQYTFLTTGGLINGKFSKTISPTGLLVKTKYTPQSAFLIFQQNSIGFPANFIGGNAGTVRSVLEFADITPGTELARVATTLNALDPGALEDSLDQLHPGLFGAWSWSSATVENRIASTVIRQRIAEYTRCCICPTFCRCGKVWFNGLGIHLNQSKVDQLRGFDTLAGAIVLGWDKYVFDHCGLLGILGSYSFADLKWDNDRGFTHEHSYYLGGYATVNWENFSCNALILGSYFHANIERNINFSVVNKRAKSNRDGWNIMEHLDFSYFFCRGNNKIYPFVSGEYFTFYYDDFKEDHADVLNLKVKTENDSLYRIEAGLGYLKEICTCYGAFIPRATLSALLFSHPSATKIKTHFASIPQGFTIHSGKHDFYAGAVSLDLGFMIRNSFFVSVGYEGEYGNKRIEQEMNVFLQWQY